MQAKILILLLASLALMSCQSDEDSGSPDYRDSDVLNIKWTNDGLNKDSDTYREIGYFIFKDKFAEQHTTCTDKSFGEDKTVKVVARTPLEWGPENTLLYPERVVETKVLGESECVSSVGGGGAQYEVDPGKGSLRLTFLEIVSPTMVLRRMD